MGVRGLRRRDPCWSWQAWMMLLQLQLRYLRPFVKRYFQAFLPSSWLKVQYWFDSFNGFDRKES